MRNKENGKSIETVYIHTKEGNKENKGITLITLVITIIILLILAGITIVQLTGSGLFGKAELAKQKTRYVTAKEIVNLKLMEIQEDCIEKNEKYNIIKVAEGMKKATDITIEKYYNKKTSKIKEDISENLTDLEGIVVSVDKYSEYKFLIGKECQILGVLEGKITDTTAKEEFLNVEEFEKKSFNISDTTQIENNKVKYLYKKGNQYKEITGGWNFHVNFEYKTSTLENNSYSCTHAEYNITTDSLDISVIPVAYGGTGSYIDFKTNNKIDLTLYDRIGILGTTENMTDGQLIGITDNSGYNWIPSITNENKVSIKNDEITYLDISDFVGEYYVQFGMGTYLNGKGKIKEIWLESDNSETIQDYSENLLYKVNFNDFIDNVEVNESKIYATFDGQSGITIDADTLDPDKKLIGTTSKTITLWYRTNDSAVSPVENVLATMGNCLREGGGNIIQFYYKQLRAATGGTACHVEFEPDNRFDDKWHFLVASFENGNRVRGYYDAQEFIGEGSYYTDNAILNIGHLSNTRYYKGDMADIRVYSSALTKKQVLQLYKYGKNLLNNK